MFRKKMLLVMFMDTVLVMMYLLVDGKYHCCYYCHNQGNKKSGGQWTRSKSFDTFSPIGPQIVLGSELSLN